MGKNVLYKDIHNQKITSMATLTAILLTTTVKLVPSDGQVSTNTNRKH